MDRDSRNNSQTGLGSPRTGRTVPPQRGTPEPPAEGRHRLPRQRHHREPRRSRKAARHPGSAGGRVGRTTAGRVTPVARPVSLSLHDHRPTARARFAPRSSRLRRVRRPSRCARRRRNRSASMSLTGARRFAKVHRQPRAIRNRNPFPLHRLPRTAGRTTPGTCAGAPAEPARTSFITASRSLLRPAVRSIATAAPPRVPRRCRFPHRSYRRFGRLYRPGRPWVPHATQRAVGPAIRCLGCPVVPGRRQERPSPSWETCHRFGTSLCFLKTHRVIQGVARHTIRVTRGPAGAGDGTFPRISTNLRVRMRRQDDDSIQ